MPNYRLPYESEYTNPIIEALLQRHLAEQQAYQRVLGQGGTGTGGERPSLGGIGRMYGNAFMAQQGGELDMLRRIFGPGGGGRNMQNMTPQEIIRMYGNSALQQNQAEMGADLKIWQALVDYLKGIMPQR